MSINTINVIRGNIYRTEAAHQVVSKRTGELLTVSNMTIEAKQPDGRKAYYRVAQWGEAAKKAEALTRGAFVEAIGTVDSTLISRWDGDTQTINHVKGRVNVWDADKKTWNQL